MSDFNEIINSDKPTLVDFYANWCSPCRTMTPIIEETKNTLGDKATVLKIDIDKNREVALKYGIRGVPTMILFQKGKTIWRQSGVVPSKMLVGEVEKIV
jgi:thioredoxin 1